jgi:hypothetical protein
MNEGMNMWASHKSAIINRRYNVRRLWYDSVSARAGYFYVSRDIKVTWSLYLLAPLSLQTLIEANAIEERTWKLMIQ